MNVCVERHRVSSHHNYGIIGEGGDTTKVGPETHMSELFPHMQAKLAMANLTEMIGLVDMLVANVEGDEEMLEQLYEGWAIRMDSIRDWAAQQAQELVVFGEAFDTDKKIEPRDEE